MTSGTELLAASWSSIFKPIDEDRLQVRVLDGTNDDKPLANIRAFAHRMRTEGNSLSGMTDADGRFDCEVPAEPMIIVAFNDDKSLGATAQLKAGQKEVVLRMHPTTGARGVLLEPTSENPISNKELLISIRLKIGSSSYSLHAPCRTTTDVDGSFEVNGLAPDTVYSTQLITDYFQEDIPSSFQYIQEFETPQEGMVDLGIVRPMYRAPRTLESIIDQSFSYDTPDVQMQKMLERVSLQKQHILALVAPRDSDVAIKFFKMQYPERGQKRLAPRSLNNYAVFAIDPDKHESFCTAHGIAIPNRVGGLALTILDAKGKVLDQMPSIQLSEDGLIDVDALDRFLRQHQISLADANQLMTEALKTAQLQDKRILVRFSAPKCPPCYLLAHYFQAHQALIEKDYLCLDLDLRMEGGMDLIKNYQGKTPSGVPWMIILDKDGKALVNSNGESGNIGFPSNPEGLAHWKKMLLETRRHLSDDEINTLMAGLETED